MTAEETPDFVEAAAVEEVAADLSERFTQLTGSDPAVVAAAPGRVNLIGEHVDYNEGRCLPLALPHSTLAAVRGREDRRLRVRSAQTEETVEVALADLRPGAVSGWAAYVAGVVWAMAQEWDLPGLDVMVDGRVPVGAGLSSSAALECSVAAAVCGLLDLNLDEPVRDRLVPLCVRAETEMAGAPTGGMDQSVSLHAGAGNAVLLDFADNSHRLVPWAPESTDLTLLVVDTKVTHELTDGGYAARRADCEHAARVLGVRSLREMQGCPDVLTSLGDGRVRRRARHVLTEMDRVDATLARLEAGEVASIGALLDASHDSLRDDYEVSCPELDLAVDTLRDHGALGARMTGGGFGGSAIGLVPVADVAPIAASVTAAFAARDFAPPAFLRAPASAGARVLTAL
jgi:galactokinase